MTGLVLLPIIKVLEILARLTKTMLSLDKKFGVGNGDPSLRSQPRLPGSVVGEASMRQGRESGKITQVTGL